MRNYDYIALLSLEWGEGCGVGGVGEREKQLFKFGYNICCHWLRERAQ